MSSRAWLQYADSVKKLEQTNLRLVIDGANLPVSRDKELYSSVMAVWKHAMKAMNDLILGRPQRINDGDVMLGLLSWHLYPDMTVLGVGTRTYHVPQQDRLIAPGGMITVGMGSREGCPDETIYWSLPLAHMRFYGDPVNAERRHGMKDSQVSYADFRYVILGSVLSSWNMENNDIDLAMQCIILLDDSISNDPLQMRNIQELDWLVSLAKCCKAFQQASEVEKKHGMALIMFGIRRCSNFLAKHDKHPLPLFGLTDMRSLIDVVNFPTPDKIQRRIDFLRWWANNHPDRSSLKGSIIRYSPARQPNDDSTVFFCTTVFRTSNRQVGHKRRRTEEPYPGNQEHLSWLIDDKLDSPQSFIAVDYSVATEMDGPTIDPSKIRTISGLQDHGIVKLPPGPNMSIQDFEFVCGDAGKAAIYRPIKRGKPALSRNAITISGFLRLYRGGLVEVARLTQQLLIRSAGGNDFFQSLKVLSHVEEIYEGLPGACVDLRVTSQPVPGSLWSAPFQRISQIGRAQYAWGSYSSAPLKIPEHELPSPITINHAFTAVAFFETGEMQLDPYKLEGVLALSHNNSIFVASQMLEDPTKPSSKYLIKRLTGNIGRPGFALLISPNDPRMREYDFNKYVVEYEQFNGDLVDSFSATSLHLSLTGYELPLDVEPRGNRDSEAYFVETNVSVYDGGDWVGDVDIMRAQKTWPHHGDCDHDVEQRKQRSHLPKSMQAVDSWKAFLDAPVGGGVLRAFGNPMARLAAATLAMQKGYKFHILSPNGCWACVRHDVFPLEPRYIASQIERQDYSFSPENVPGEISNMDTEDEDDHLTDNCSSESGSDDLNEEEPKTQPGGLYSAGVGDAPADDIAQDLFPELEPICQIEEEPTDPTGLNFAVDVMFIC